MQQLTDFISAKLCPISSKAPFLPSILTVPCKQHQSPFEPALPPVPSSTDLCCPTLPLQTLCSFQPIKKNNPHPSKKRLPHRTKQTYFPRPLGGTHHHQPHPTPRAWICPGHGSALAAAREPLQTRPRHPSLGRAGLRLPIPGLSFLRHVCWLSPGPRTAGYCCWAVQIR